MLIAFFGRSPFSLNWMDYITGCFRKLHFEPLCFLRIFPSLFTLVRITFLHQKSGTILCLHFVWILYLQCSELLVQIPPSHLLTAVGMGSFCWDVHRKYIFISLYLWLLCLFSQPRRSTTGCTCNGTISSASREPQSPSRSRHRVACSPTEPPHACRLSHPSRPRVVVAGSRFAEHKGIIFS